MVTSQGIRTAVCFVFFFNRASEKKKILKQNMYFCKKDLQASVGLCSLFHPKSEAKLIGNAAYNVHWDEDGQAALVARL